MTLIKQILNHNVDIKNTVMERYDIRLLRQFRGYVIPVAILAVWQLSAAEEWLPRSLLPLPADIIYRTNDMILTGEILSHITSSLYRLLTGLFIGVPLGVFFGILVGIFRSAESFISPTLRFLTPVPVLAWMPIIVALLGIDEGAKIALLAIGAFFILYAATVSAVRSIDANLMELGRLFQKRVPDIVLRVVIPICAPAIFEGIRAAVSLSWVVLVIAEIVASRNGLGWLLWDARTFGRTTDAFIAMIIVGLLGLITDTLVRGVQTRIVRWRSDFHGH